MLEGKLANKVVCLEITVLRSGMLLTSLPPPPLQQDTRQLRAKAEFLMFYFLHNVRHDYAWIIGKKKSLQVHFHCSHHPQPSKKQQQKSKLGMVCKEHCPGSPELRLKMKVNTGTALGPANTSLNPFPLGLNEGLGR